MRDVRHRESAEGLTLGPSWVQAVKPAVTRARTATWQLGRRDAPAGLRILFYHRVADDRDPLAVPPDHFRAQMDVLRSGGYRVLDVRTAAELLGRGEPTDGVVALSFDDGYRDIADRALPVLEHCGFRASVFLATGLIDGTTTPSWYRKPPPMLRWSDVTRLDRASAFSFEAHTITHPNLLALDRVSAQREIAGSKLALEARLGRPVEAFCYPAGLVGPRERELVARAGFRAATTCEPGANLPSTDPLLLRRIPIDPRDRLADFRAKLEGGFDRPSALRATYRRLRFGRTAQSSER
jgi:peptidoglycan/xylan/chitin deacetylase (PgdA/CDA1 family)